MELIKEKTTGCTCERGYSAVIDKVKLFNVILRPVVLRNMFSHVLPFLCH